MPVAPDIDKLAEEVARRIHGSSDKSNLSTFNKIRDVVRGAGIGEAQQPRYFRAVQRRLAFLSARKRQAKAAEAQHVASNAEEMLRRYP